MGKIRIDRKRHARKGYKRKGKYVKPTIVKRTIYLAKDRGRKGRERRPKHLWSRKIKFDKIPGYSIKKSQRTRLAALRRNIRAEGSGKKGRLSTARTLQAVINVNPSKKSDKVMTSDLKKIYPGWGR